MGCCGGSRNKASSVAAQQQRAAAKAQKPRMNPLPIPPPPKHDAAPLLPSTGATGGYNITIGVPVSKKSPEPEEEEPEPLRYTLLAQHPHGDEILMCGGKYGFSIPIKNV